MHILSLSIIPSCFIQNLASVNLQGLGSFVIHKTQCPQIYIKLTLFEDNDGRKLPFKFYLLRCCSFWEISKTKSQTYFRLSWKHLSMIFTFFFLKNLTTNVAEYSPGKLYYIHLHSQWVGIHAMAKNLQKSINKTL